MSSRPHAFAFGNGDLVRALGLGGIRSTVIAPPDEPARWSRHARGWVDDREDGLLERLEAVAGEGHEPPVLHVARDRALHFVARHRARLAASFRFAVAEDPLLDRLLDKAAFVDLAHELGLPVPRTVVAEPADLERVTAIRPPLLVKPASRGERWFAFAGWPKALSVQDEAEWAALRQQLAAAGMPVLVQELITGGEDRIESYHVYVDRRGRTLGEFTGRKIRTRPAAFGVSTALTTTDTADTLELGRVAIDALRLRGPAKADFKRAPDGRLVLLEVNPRLSLWAHLGAAAGVNLAALAHADLGGGTPAPAGPARPGVTWCEPRQDRLAAAEQGMRLRPWLRWLATCDVRAGYAPDDPMPVLAGKVWPRLAALRARV